MAVSVVLVVDVAFAVGVGVGAGVRVGVAAAVAVSVVFSVAVAVIRQIPGGVLFLPLLSYMSLFLSLLDAAMVMLFFLLADKRSWNF